MSENPLHPGGRAQLLQADCGNCFGLCCVALAFAKSADFAFDKPAGEPCVNLEHDFRCGVHPELRERGFKGCTVFDCFGAGQKVSQTSFAGESWREHPELRQRMFAVFPIVRRLHELLWYLDEAARLPAAAALRDELERAYAETTRLTELEPSDILGLDVDSHHDAVNLLLARASELVRTGARPDPRKSDAGKPDAKRGPKGKLARKLRPGADLMGATLAGEDLRGANLRGAYLIAADLRGADLGSADLIGADLRDAQLAGADLSTALFLSQAQLNSAKGDASTVLPASVARPSHW